VAIVFENPVPILAVGAVVATLCGLVFLSKRTLPALFALLGVVLLTLLLVVCEWWVVTEREEVELALAELLAAVEANDMQATVALVDTAAANLRSDIELGMPMVKVSDTGASAVNITVDSSVDPHEATSRFRGKLQGVYVRSGMKVLYFDDVEMHWVKRDDQWLLESFVEYLETGSLIHAIESVQGNRAAPAAR